MCLKNNPYLCATLHAAGEVRGLYQQRSTLFEIVTLYRPPPHQDGGRARAAGNRIARNDEELGPQLGETITRRAAS